MQNKSDMQIFASRSYPSNSEPFLVDTVSSHLSLCFSFQQFDPHIFSDFISIGSKFRNNFLSGKVKIPPLNGIRIIQR